MLEKIDVKKALGIEAESKVERNDTPSTTREHQHQNQDNISQVNSQLRAAANTLKVLKPLSMALNEVEGQISIDTEMRDA